MRLVYAFDWLPVPVFKKKPPNDFRGYTRIFTWLIIPSCWIYIHPDYWEDEHILIHELQHVEDYLRNPWLYYRRYKTQKGRLKFEVRAYARQYLSYDEPDQTLSRFNWLVSLIMTRYNLSFENKVVVEALERAVLRLSV